MGKFIGLSQYKAPFSYELAGKHFHIVMDNGNEYSLFFIDGETVQYAKKGEPYIWESYECLKGDETTFFVHLQPSAGKGLINYSLILDTAQRLVTFVLMEEGYDPKYPRLIRTTPFFGAIKVPGRELPKIRHHLDNRMVGKHIFWHYQPGYAIQHIYHSPTCIRASSGGGFASASEALEHQINTELANAPEEVLETQRRRLASIRSRESFYPYYEEPCFHIWINDHLNLFCFLEEIMMRRAPGYDAGGGGILLLQDIEREIDVGLSFCKGEYYMCTAYGEENEDPDPLDTRETIYDWDVLDAMPSIRWEQPKKE